MLRVCQEVKYWKYWADDEFVSEKMASGQHLNYAEMEPERPEQEAGESGSKINNLKNIFFL